MLGQGSILTMTSQADRTSPVIRGKWVMEVLLGTPPPPPPPNVPSLEATKTVKDGHLLTTRERMEAHRSNPACTSCHRMIDPIGLVLENFDPTGSWRIRDNGVPIDSSTVLFDGTPAKTPADLRQTLLKYPEAFIGNFTENLLTFAGGTPLYRVVDLQWAPKSFYPQPNARQEKVSYLELMKALLAHGADPNARLTAQLWYTGYGFELDGVEPAGATPFWRAAQVGDVDAMKLLVAAGADPNIATNEGVTPLLVAAGDGFHGNDAVTVPYGRMAAVSFLVEDCKADVNALDKKAGESTSILHTNSRAYTPLHSAAARGDNEMILYLVSKGARVDIVGKNGLTVADMANGPRERIQPFPETIKLLVGLGAKNNNRCISC